MDKNLEKAIYKISSAMTNYDLIDAGRNRFFTGSFKKNTVKFFKFCEHHIALSVETLYQGSFWNPVVCDGLDNIGCFTEQDDSEEIILMVAKLQSALNDLKLVESSLQNNLLVGPLEIRLKVLLSSGCAGKLGIVGLDNLIKHIDEECSLRCTVQAH